EDGIRDRNVTGVQTCALPISREIDPIALDQIFTFWVSLPPRTIFKEICELPPGHSMTVEGGVVTVKRYWEPRFATTTNGAHSERSEERRVGKECSPRWTPGRR